MKCKLSLVCVLVKDLEKSMKYYSKLLGFKQPKHGPYSNIIKIDEPGLKFKYAFLQSGFLDDCYLEPGEPIEGPQVDLLKKYGEGYIWEVSFRVEDIEETYDELVKMGIQPLDMAGNPLTKDKILAVPTGTKCIYIPKKVAGFPIEFIERAF